MQHESLIAGFLRSVEVHTARPALTVAGQTLTYAQLHEEAWAIANGFLADSGQGLTAVYGRKAVFTYAGVIAGLLKGVGYVPLNPEFPETRTAAMLQRSGARRLVVEESVCESLSAVLATFGGEPLEIVLDRAIDAEVLRSKFPEHEFNFPAEPLVEKRYSHEPEDIAYLLFTSGSTGEPKGVGVTHANVTHFLQAAQAEFNLTCQDRCSQMFALTFDLSVFDMFLTWSAGACLCVPTPGEHLKPGRYINESDLTVWFSVPSTGLFMEKFRQLKPASYPQLRLALFCGEALSVNIAKRWRDAATNAEIVNLYGPTEATIACSVYYLNKTMDQLPEGTAVPIGQAMAGTKLEIVDTQLSKVGDGEAGELLINGPQVTPGYWHDQARTAKAFVMLESGERYYRTGDLVRRASSHQPIEYLGRIDFQVQVNGYRVELGEVETLLRSHPGIDEAVVIGWPSSDHGCETLIAFLHGNETNIAELNKAVTQKLPNYMVPSRFHVVEQFPLNSNGKIDRNALADSIKE